MKKLIVIAGLLFCGMNSLTSNIAHADVQTDYVLIVEVKVKPEVVAQFKDALLSIVAPTRLEDGNLAYIAHQSPDDPTDFMVYEHWESDEAHVQHLQSPMFVNYSKMVAPMIEAGYPVRKKMIEID